MQRMQRITGRFLTRTPNEADVEAMLKDFTDSQVMLEKVRPVWLNISHCSVL
jgi:RimJ/RimL family protein N-acetyltransferase